MDVESFQIDENVSEDIFHRELTQEEREKAANLGYWISREEAVALFKLQPPSAGSDLNDDLSITNA